MKGPSKYEFMWMSAMAEISHLTFSACKEFDTAKENLKKLESDYAYSVDWSTQWLEARMNEQFARGVLAAITQFSKIMREIEDANGLLAHGRKDGTKDE